jgi:2'-5' RNA ligase
MVQLGIAILLPDEVHNAVRRLQLAVAQACGANHALRQTPHVTLKQPFHAKALEPVESYFDELVATFDPLDIRLHGVDVFEVDRVIFANVEADAPLEALRLEVLRELGERFRVKPRDVEDERYRFHSTLAYNLTEEQLGPARQTLADVDFDLRFRIETLGLFYYTGDVWIAYKRSRIAASTQPAPRLARPRSRLSRPRP